MDFNGWGASFTANSQFEEMSQKMVKEEHFFVKTESACSVYEIVMDPYNPPEMTEGFIRAAKTLEDKNNYEAYLNFVKVYGTHALYTTHMGAKYVEQTEMTKVSKELLDQENIDVDIAASYSTQFHLGINIPTEEQKKLVEKYKWDPRESS